MPEGGPLWRIVILLILILINGFFAMSEIAIISVNEQKLRKLAEDGNKKAVLLKKLTDDPSKFLSTIQIGVTLSGFLASAFAADTFVDDVVALFAGSAIPAATVRTAALIVITLLLAYLTLVFGELVPKRLAMKEPEKVSFASAGVLRAISKVSTPFIWLLSKSTNGVLRLLGIDPDDNEHEVTEEEIRLMVDEGEQGGTIDSSEQEMIHNIFEFDDLDVGDVMTHRTEVESVDIDSTLEEIISTAEETGHSRLPVCGEDGLDDIVGVLMVKDLLKFVTEDHAGFSAKDYLRAVVYVPETAPCNEVFEELRKKRSQLAVVVDEYGGTAGIVTVEDLLESIVGSIQDEYDDEPEPIIKLADGSWQLDGMAYLEDIEEELGIKFDDVGDYDTIAGFVTDRLHRIPEPDERPSVEASGFRFTVTGVEEHHITGLLAERLPSPAENKPE